MSSSARSTIFFLLMTTSAAPSVYAVDKNRLWLPEKHSRLFLDLRDAAEAAEALDRCVEVLKGTIDMEQSVLERPVYRILCRQEDGKSYNEMVDGVSFETLTTRVVQPIALSPEEKESQRLAEEKRLEEEKATRLSALWQTCETQLNKKIRYMTNIRWLTRLPPEPVEQESLRFDIDFDAEDPYKNPLHYRASCLFSDKDELNLRISARRDS